MRVPAPTFCDRCGDIFAYIPGARDRPKKPRCQNCDAGTHWERGADPDTWTFNTPATADYVVVKSGRGQIRVRTEPKTPQAPNPLSEGMGPNPSLRRALEAVIAAGVRGWVSAAELTFEDAPAVILDVDGTPISVAWLMQTEGNHGRRKVNGAWEPLEEVVADRLAEGGWFIEKAGGTGRRRGRPTKGVTDPQQVIGRLEAGLSFPLVDVSDLLRRGPKSAIVRERYDELVRHVRSEVNHHERPLNVAAVRLQLSTSRSWAYTTAGPISDKNPLIGEEVHRMQIASDAQLAQTVSTLEACRDVIDDCARLIASRFPTDEKVQEAVSQFIASVEADRND